MIRIIVQTQNCNVAAHVSGAGAERSFTTFDVDAPEVEQFMAASSNGYETKQFVGVELLPNGHRDPPKTLADRLARCVRIGFVSRRSDDKDMFDVDDLLEVSEVAQIVAALRASAIGTRPDRAKTAIRIAGIMLGRVSDGVSDETYWVDLSPSVKRAAFAVYDLMANEIWSAS